MHPISDLKILGPPIETIHETIDSKLPRRLTHHRLNNMIEQYEHLYISGYLHDFGLIVHINSCSKARRRYIDGF